jgi:anti-anti-sigma regulatory factor
MFVAERRAAALPLTFDETIQPDALAGQIDGLAQLGEPRVCLSLLSLDNLDFRSLQTLLSAREYCIQRGLVMRLTDVSDEVRERIQWADAGRLLEDDLMLV